MSKQLAMDTAEVYMGSLYVGDTIVHGFLLPPDKIYKECYYSRYSDPIPYSEFLSLLESLRCHKDSSCQEGV